MFSSRYSPTSLVLFLARASAQVLARTSALLPALTLAVIFTSATAEAQAQTDAKAQTYTVDFPADMDFADIQIIERKAGSRRAKGPKIRARGRVVLPKDCNLSIELCYDGPAHINLIHLIDANQITRFSSAKLEFDDQQLIQLQECKNLAVLELDSSLVSEKSWPSISKFANLVSLRVCKTDITGGGFEALAKLNNLASLNIEGTALKPGSLAKLRPLAAHLTSLNLSRTGLTAVDLPALSDLRALTTLDLGGNSQMDDSCIKYLLPLENLATLGVSDTKVTEKSLPELCKLPKLNILTIRGGQFWRFGRPPKTNYRFTFNDESVKTHLPIEMFSPLH